MSKIFLPLMLTAGLLGAGQVQPPGIYRVIGGVPDWNQPPASNSTNYCAPVAALNILDYWQNVMNSQHATGLVNPNDASVYPSGSNTADLIGYFMGTNGMGSNCRTNNMAFPTPGTFVSDQDTGLEEYIAWNAANQFCPGDPMPPNWKVGHLGWIVSTDYAGVFGNHIQAIGAGLPDKIDFNFWNPIYSGNYFIDTIYSSPPETVYIYSWGDSVSYSTNPEEQWGYDIGHATTGVGYAMNNDSIYAIVHDNWPSTHRNVMIPWDHIMAVLYVTPPPTLISESASADEQDVLTVTRKGRNLTFSFNLSKGSAVELILYDASGRSIEKIASARFGRGEHTISWDASKLRSGIYFALLKNDGHRKAGTRFLLIR